MKNEFLDTARLDALFDHTGNTPFGK